MTMIRRIAKDYAAFAAILLTQACYGIYPIDRYGTPEQKEQYLPAFVEGKWIAGLGYSEGQNLENIEQIETQAFRTEDGWCLAGKKTIISNSQVADTFFILAKVKESGKEDQFGFFIVDRQLPKIQIGERCKEPGLQGLPVSSVVFENVLLPPESLLGGVLNGQESLNDFIQVIQLGLSAIALGIAEGAFEKGLEFVKVKRGFGKRLIDVAVHQNTFADLHTKLCAAEAYFSSYDAQLQDSLFVSQIKLFTSKVAIEVADEVRRLIGPTQKIEETQIDRYFKDAETIEIYGKSGNSIRKRIARQWVEEE